MHDPKTVAWEIRYPWWKRRPWPKGTQHFDDIPESKQKRRDPWWKEGYRETFITIWHNDPETDGSDDSCGWFMRSRHGDKLVLERIIKRFESDWDRVFIGDEGKGKHYYCGFFYPENAGAGMPNMSVTAIVLNLFFLAAIEHFKEDGRTNWKKGKRFMRKHLFDIMLFAENPTDSLRNEIVRKWGTDSRREDRIRNVAQIVYGWILRKTRPWYKHPRFHVHHLSIQCHPWQKIRRWLLSRCCKCGGRFKYGETPVTHQWESAKLKFLRGEKDIMHDQCSGTACDAEKGGE